MGSCVRRVAFVMASIVVLGCLWMLAPLTANAATLTVANCLDSGSGSLRAQIGAAANGDTIKFQAGMNCTITLTSGALTISTNNLTIDATGATIVVDGGCTFSGGQCQPGTGVGVFVVNFG